MASPPDTASRKDRKVRAIQDQLRRSSETQPALEAGGYRTRYDAMAGQPVARRFARRPRRPPSPVAGRILFCGEHTHRNRYANSDGAMTIGIREVKRLLRAASVTLRAG